MKIVVNGDPLDLLKDHLVGDLRLLEREYGFGYGTALKRISSIDKNASVLDLIDNGDVWDAILGLIWLARLGRGERDLTKADMDRMPIGSMQFLDDSAAQPEVDESVPTSAPTDSVRGAAAVPPNPGLASKKRSTSRSKKQSSAA